MTEVFIDNIEKLYIERSILYGRYILYEKVNNIIRNDNYYNFRKNGIPEDIFYILGVIFNGSNKCTIDLNNRSIYGRVSIENLNYFDRWNKYIEHDNKSETNQYGFNTYIWTCSRYLHISYVRYDNGIDIENILVSTENMMEFEKKIHNYIENVY